MQFIGKTFSQKFSPSLSKTLLAASSQSKRISRKVAQLQQKGLTRLRHSGLLGQYDLVFVIHEGNRGWILEAICKEIAAYFPGSYCYHYSTSLLPPAKAYFFSHYSLFAKALQANPQFKEAKTLVFYTHPSGIGLEDEFIDLLNRSATKVIFTCSRNEQELRSRGLKPEKTTCIRGAADPKLFQPHPRESGAVGFCAAYYARKDPDRVLSIIKAMPHRKFILLGRNWQQYERFPEMLGLPNFSYVEAPYADYPQHYAQMDVFVSPSKLEGGTIALIETMMCNVFPVVSDTGHNPDIISHGKNGFIFDIEAPVTEICDLIEQAYGLKDADISATVQHLSWKNYSLEVQKLLQLS
jgi:glycosyltransferase involved in cell wall biosynthesis